MSNKINLKRIKNMNDIDLVADNYIISENNNIKSVNKFYFSSFLNSDDVIKDFKIISINDNIITYSDGSLLSPEINGKRYKLNIIGESKNIDESIDNNGTADKINSKLWNQPILSANDSSEYMTVEAEDYLNEYYPWKAFDGSNIDERDCWHTTESSLPKWLQINFKYPLTIDTIAIQNRNITETDTHAIMISFKIYGLNLNDEWEEIIYVDNINTIVKNKTNNAWNDYEPYDNDKLYKAIKYVCLSSIANVSVSIGRFEIIGRYKGYSLPESYYNVFVIGKENEENPEPKIITTLDEYPTMPEGYTYGIKLGYFKTQLDKSISYFYPKQDLATSYENRFIIAEQLGTTGYRIYSDGWKEQWGISANPTFPVAFDEIPLIVERGATNVTKTGMTIAEQRWKVEGY